MPGLDSAYSIETGVCVLSDGFSEFTGVAAPLSSWHGVCMWREETGRERTLRISRVGEGYLSEAKRI